MQQVRVISHNDGLGTLGVMNPKVGMTTLDHGVILSVLIDSAGSGDRVRVTSPSGSTPYASQVRVVDTVAAGYGWPSGSDCVPYGHGVATTTPYYTNPGKSLNTTFHKADKPFTFINKFAASGEPQTPIL